MPVLNASSYFGNISAEIGYRSLVRESWDSVLDELIIIYVLRNYSPFMEPALLIASKSLPA
jgi:hypothetical protein